MPHITARSAARLLPRVAARAALLALIACTESKAPRAADGATAGVDMRATSGVWSDADEKSTWSAVRDDANTWRIDELAQFGEDGRATRRFLFDTVGAIRFIAEQTEQTAQSGNATPGPMRSVLEVEFSGDSAIRVSKQVDGRDREVQSFEIDNARRHALSLWLLARRAVPPS